MWFFEVDFDFFIGLLLFKIVDSVEFFGIFFGDLFCWKIFLGLKNVLLVGFDGWGFFCLFFNLVFCLELFFFVFVIGFLDKWIFLILLVLLLILLVLFFFDIRGIFFIFLFFILSVLILFMFLNLFKLYLELGFIFDFMWLDICLCFLECGFCVWEFLRLNCLWCFFIGGSGYFFFGVLISFFFLFCWIGLDLRDLVIFEYEGLDFIWVFLIGFWEVFNILVVVKGS